MQTTLTPKRHVARHNMELMIVAVVIVAAIVGVVLAGMVRVPTESSADVSVAAPLPRTLTNAYLTLKANQVERADAALASTTTFRVASPERYATIKDSQLERADAVIGTLPTGRANYATLKQNQFDHLDTLFAPTTLRSERYYDLKAAQFDLR